MILSGQFFMITWVMGHVFLIFESGATSKNSPQSRINTDKI